MADDTLTRSIRRALRAKRAALIEALASGSCKDFAHYKHMVGQIIAFDDAVEVVAETARSYFGEEDEDDNE